MRIDAKIAVFNPFFRIVALTGLLASLLGACTDDGVLRDEAAEQPDGELPVVFEFALPAATRTELIQDWNSFQDKDVIHIEGTFTLDSEPTATIRYGAMQYDAANRRWNPVSDSQLTWPDTATGGSFRAFFVHRSQSLQGGVIQPGEQSLTYNLSELQWNNDPLQAATDPDQPLPYGHAVRLEFSHVCSFLTIRGIGGMAADRLWFTSEKVKREETDTEGHPLNNAFYLKREADNSLELVFTQSPDANYKDLVYISAAPQSVKNDTQVQFFLEPGYYDRFALNYPVAPSETTTQIEYTYVPSGEESHKPQLEANHSYLLDISKSKGITINNPPKGEDEENWHDAGDPELVDYNDFLRAVVNAQDYVKDGKEILKANGRNGTKLLCNVSFNYEKYTLLKKKGDETEDFDPVIPVGNTFDGGYYYIEQIGCPIFHRNLGTIKNLGLRDIQAAFISDESDDISQKSRLDRSRNGILCMWNETTGIIENIRISGGAEITAQVKNDTDTEQDKEASQETHNIGCIIGSNTGRVADVALSGTFRLTVEGYADESINKDVDATVMIGGIVGQNAGNGSITNVAPYDETNDPLQFVITNTCAGNLGAYYVGGIAGASSSLISWVTLPQVTVDSSQSESLALYMGGIAGELSLIGTQSAATSSCVISGTVQAGKVAPAGEGTAASKSYIGGLSGALGQAVTDCRTSVAVTVPAEGSSGVIYATGGAFGRILAVEGVQLENITAYGTSLTGPAQCIGYFAGIVPAGKSWTDYQSLNILLNEYNGTYPAIGESRDGE